MGVTKSVQLFPSHCNLSLVLQWFSFVSSASHLKGGRPPNLFVRQPAVIIGNYHSLNVVGNPNLEAAINLPNTHYLPAQCLWPSLAFNGKLMTDINSLPNPGAVFDGDLLMVCYSIIVSWWWYCCGWCWFEKKILMVMLAMMMMKFVVVVMMMMKKKVFVNLPNTRGGFCYFFTLGRN